MKLHQVPEFEAIFRINDIIFKAINPQKIVNVYMSNREYGETMNLNMWLCGAVG